MNLTLLLLFQFIYWNFFHLVSINICFQTHICHGVWSYSPQIHVDVQGFKNEFCVNAAVYLLPLPYLFVVFTLSITTSL